MLKINSSATISQAKKASSEYLKLIEYHYCDTQGKEDYNYMQGMYDAIKIIENELKIKF